jgi:hypothetical protein
LELTVSWLRSPGRAERLDDTIADEIQRHLDVARAAAVDSGLSPLQRLLSFLKGASVERTWGEIDAAGEALLRGAPSDFALGQLPRLRRRAERALKPTDSRRAGLQAIADTPPIDLSVADREVMVTALHAANCEARRKQSRPGLSALDTPAQIIGWAIVFGYAQQLFTRFVDARAQTVLDTATGQETVAGGRARI